MISKAQETKITDLQKKELKILNIGFISSSISTTLGILSASIIIIQLSQLYKQKRRYQSALFLFTAIILLFISIVYNQYVMNIMLKNKKKYKNIYFVPIIFQFITTFFIIYTFYSAMKRVNLL
tara:strand:- start:827 stop:1195 length:369 start_codon:yes stop_codon:yes gene_type:complete